MKDGFLKVAAVTPQIRVADVKHNCEEIVRLSKEAAKEGAGLIVFPELCITGYTCQDLFLQETLIRGAKEGLKRVISETAGMESLIFVGLPYEYNGKLYNVAAAVYKGRLLALIPKKYMPNYGEYYEVRHFYPGREKVVNISFDGYEVPFGMNILLRNVSGLPVIIAAEICEDLWTANPPSTNHALAGANIIVNLSGSNEVVSKGEYRKKLVSMTSARLLCGYVYSSCGEGESTQDVVFGGHRLIAENGSLLSEGKIFSGEELTVSEIDLFKLNAERRRMTTFAGNEASAYTFVDFDLKVSDTILTRKYFMTPFVPYDENGRRERCEEILNIQAFGLKKRLKHIGCKTAVVGLSGGLDSTLALLVMVRAFELLGLDKSGIICVTMPCFGTTDRTYNNACSLAASLGATLKEIDIKAAVRQHFSDIGHDESIHDVTYENGQARERTKILMDLANKLGGIVIGTGDMSELALGWATYNGDHMSMYGVNVGVPKTLVKHLVKYYADECATDKSVSEILYDILDTPVSPELLPPENGEIAQKTEDLVGPYELHDFYLYYMLRFGFSPEKIFRLAKLAFSNVYDDTVILKWEKVFFRRFFQQHFKRSCLPDGPKVGTVAVSPRGDLRMPTDAVAELWMAELEGMD